MLTSKNCSKKSHLGRERMWTLFAEAIVLTFVVGAIARFVWPEDLGLTALELHPAWIVMLVLAARYGPAGLLLALASAGAMYGSLYYLRLDAGAFVPRLERHVDLLPLLASSMVAFVAMSHQHRYRRLRDDYEEELDTSRIREEWAEGLAEANSYLRARCDRLDGSLAQWRRAAYCLERGDLNKAADAALELAMSRVGARGGYVVYQREGESHLACREQVTDDACTRDQTLALTLRDAQPHLVFDLHKASAADSDVTIPVLDSREGELIGALALWGVDPLRLQDAEMHELSVVADWLSPALEKHVKGPRLRSASAQKPSEVVAI